MLNVIPFHATEGVEGGRGIDLPTLDPETKMGG